MRFMPASFSRIRKKAGSADQHCPLLPARPHLENEGHTKPAAVLIF